MEIADFLKKNASVTSLITGTVLNEESCTALTPLGLIHYAALQRPQKNKPEPGKAANPDDKGKYKLDLLLPPEADLTILMKMANAAGRQKFGTNIDFSKPALHVGIKSPFGKAEEKILPEKLWGPDSGKSLDGWTLIRANTSGDRGRPIVRDGKQVPLTDEQFPVLIYKGAFGRIEVRAKWYETKDEGTGAVAKGVKFYLNAAQVMKGGTKFLNANTDSDGSGFEAVDDGDDTDVDESALD